MKMALDTIKNGNERRVYLYSPSVPSMIGIKNQFHFFTTQNHFMYGNKKNEPIPVLTKKEKFMIMEAIFNEDSIFDDTRDLLFYIIRE